MYNRVLTMHSRTTGNWNGKWAHVRYLFSTDYTYIYAHAHLNSCWKHQGNPWMRTTLLEFGVLGRNQKT